MKNIDLSKKRKKKNLNAKIDTIPLDTPTKGTQLDNKNFFKKKKKMGTYKI